MPTPINPTITNPEASINKAMEAGENPFARYAGSRDEWLQVLIRSIKEPVIDDIAFPAYPPQALQQRIHGGETNRHSIESSFEFYDVVRAHVGEFRKNGRLLDFGSGWGRIVRPYMPHFDLKNIVGLEPNPWFCQIARALNPYVNFINGEYAPPSMLRAGMFDYFVSWSVFSHLSEKFSKAWIAEFARISRPGATMFLTTFGEMFIDWLQEEADNIAKGEPQFWYRGAVLKRAGDLEALRTSYRAGEYVWIKGANEYGEALIPEAAMRAMLPENVTIERIDHKTLPQTLYVLKRA